MSGRIGYIDSLKGLSMLMVVMGHIIIFCTLNYENEFVRHIVLINMPLFFFLNGLVVRNIGGGNLVHEIKRKFIALLIPFFAWGGLITLFRDATYIEFLNNFFKFGYWYLLVLFQFYLISYLCDIVLNCIPKKNILIETVLLYVMVYSFLRICTRFIPAQTNIIIDYYQVIEYLPFFFLGIVVKRFSIGNNIERNSSVWATSLLIGSFHLYFMWNISPTGLITFSLRVSLILLVFLLFIRYDKCGNRCLNYTNSMLSQIGRHTLAIYMIQYFLFRYIKLTTIGTYLYDSHNLIAFLILIVVVSVVDCYICIAIEKVIATSRLFSFILLGKPFVLHASVSPNN